MNQTDREDVQRFVDGLLDERQSAALQQRMARDPELAAELELCRQVNQSVRRSFGVPTVVLPRSSQVEPAGVGPTGTEPAAPMPARRWPLFVAGAVSAAALLLAWLRPWTASAPALDDLARVELLRMAVGRSWLAACGQTDVIPPQVSCKTTDDVPGYVQPLVPQLPSPLSWRVHPEVRFVRGLEGRPQEGLRILELSVEGGSAVFLFVVAATADPRPVLPAASDWQLFDKRVGPLVIYELTPLEQPRGLQCLEIGP